MTFGRAVAYFLREACVGLVRGWKTSLLAVLTIALSLFMGGGFLLVSHRLAVLVGEWQRRSEVIVYLQEGAGEGEAAGLAELLAASWVTEIERVSAEEAGQRFRRWFPTLAGLLTDIEGQPLPASIEIGIERGRAAEGELEAWLAALRQAAGVALVDDDRAWLAQLEAASDLARGAAAVLGAVLLAAAVLTTAAVIRLAAFLHQDEIATLRLVGATEFYIRGPFYAEGLLQGLAGALVAVGGLWGVEGWFSRGAPGTLLAGLIGERSLAGWQIALLAALGGLAGLAGAVLSVRREVLSGGAGAAEPWQHVKIR